MAYCDDLQLVCCTSKACPDSFPSNDSEKYPDHKSIHDLDPDKPGCILSCLGGEIDPYLVDVCTP